jgi:hypothetical protein
MQFFPFLLSMMLLSGPDKDRIYSHEENLCSFTYSTTRQWMLQLREQGTFRLRYSSELSGVTKKRTYDVIGTWETRNDTVVLSASPTLMNECYFRSAKFVTVDGSLKPVGGGNQCLPQIFKPGIWFTIWDGHLDTFFK